MINRLLILTPFSFVAVIDPLSIGFFAGIILGIIVVVKVVVDTYKEQNPKK